MAVEARKIAQLNSPATQQRLSKLRERRVRIGSAHSPTTTLLNHILAPIVSVSMLLIVTLAYKQPFDAKYLILSLLIFLLTAQMISPPPPRSGRKTMKWMRSFAPKMFFEWACVVGVLLFVGFAIKSSAMYSRLIVICWCFITPMALVAAEVGKARLSKVLGGNSAKIVRHIVVGANELGMELSRRTYNTCGSHLSAYFDDRDPERLPEECRSLLRGNCSTVAKYVQQNHIDAIYVALPLSAAPRMIQLLDELRDTTASIYFIPDIFSFDIIQARFVEIDGMPVVSVCDTPFNGISALIKRGMDIVFSLMGLLFLWPVLLAVAVAVKLSSSGNILFKQRRYGLNGEEIMVYKFRSMTVCEDGGKVTQATKDDKRVTRLGAFLRKTSLDELPQIINVLQGRMSIVGPRPHAVAHNEQYRKLISGYMIRHKVRPGITGWAQVNGLRGETDTIEKMRQRVEYDLDYLRHWSVWLDIKIIFKTIKLVIHDSKAY
jgi:putative colanic acid biosynthesis UDP-glucose lipid carrier transferase